MPAGFCAPRKTTAFSSMANPKRVVTSLDFRHAGTST
jgi:hypothetical protein